MIVLGIDPGKSGGIAWQKLGERSSATALPFPATEAEMRGLLRSILEQDAINVLAFIERVGATPQMGVSSAFTFGRGYGFLRGLLIGMAIPFEEVSPQKWQGDFGLRMGKKLAQRDSEKHNQIKGKAEQLFPWVKMTHAKSAALLICEYGARQHRLKESA